jgi:exosome complex RNA-binding protein Rrp4
VTIGLNGYIWVSKHISVTQEMLDDPKALYSDENDVSLMSLLFLDYFKGNKREDCQNLQLYLCVFQTRCLDR